MLQRFLGFVVISSVFLACANGLLEPERDGGTTPKDSGKGNDGSTIQDSAPPPQKDSSTPIQDGSTCNFTVCGSLCVDTTQDDQNCGQCNKVCPSGSSCMSSTCQCSGGMTLCTSGCTDTMTDMSNCGSCGKVCGSTETCMSGICTAQASGTPPQGTCAHSLCDDSTALSPGCDTTGCVTSVCSADSYCCTDFWDSICDSEVADYCSPYSCP